MRTRTLYTNVTTVGNVGTGEDDLMSWTLPANLLGTDEVGFQAQLWGAFAANTNNKTLKFYFDGVAFFDTTAVATNGGTWHALVTVMRTGSSAQKIVVQYNQMNGAGTSATTTINATDAADTTTALIFKVTAEATSNNDITQQGMVIQPVAYA